MPDEVLADVVDVALDRADDDLADGLGARLGQERPQDGHAGLHGVGGQEHLRHEQDAVAEVDTHDLHAGHQRIVEHARGAPATAEQDIRALHDLGGHAVVEVVVHLLGQLLVGEGRQVDLSCRAIVTSSRLLVVPPCGTVPYDGTSQPQCSGREGSCPESRPSSGPSSCSGRSATGRSA